MKGEEQKVVCFSEYGHTTSLSFTDTFDYFSDTTNQCFHTELTFLPRIDTAGNSRARNIKEGRAKKLSRGGGEIEGKRRVGNNDTDRTLSFHP